MQHIKCRKCKKLHIPEKMENQSRYYRTCSVCRTKENELYISVRGKIFENFPNLQEEWDSEKNSKQPEYCKNNEIMWWKCKTGNKCHVWQETIKNRKRTSCPFCSNRKMCKCGCNSIWGTNPELRDEWIEEKNGDMKLYAPGSEKKVWWRCKTGNKCHVWQSVIYAKNGCPFCCNQKICECGCNSVWATNPELRDEWIEEKNGDMKSYAPKSNKKVWWKCKTGNKCHIWESTINNRKIANCPYCSNQKICECGCNSVWMTNPELRDEWIEEKNGDMKLYGKGSVSYVWWKCKTGNKCHIWKSAIRTRTKELSANCPFCVNLKICKCGCNSLWATNRELRDEWIEEKNGNMKSYAPNTSKKVWWKCKTGKDGHVWVASISKRNGKDNRNCPFCNESKLEAKMTSILNSYNIVYEREKRIEDCKHIRNLPYDFYIKYSKNIRVELQGSQHFNFEYFQANNMKLIEQTIKKDSIKCLSAFLAGDCFLSISYMCLHSLNSVFSSYLNSVNTLSDDINNILYFYITDKIYIQYIQYKNGKYKIISNVTHSMLKNSAIYKIFECYHLQIQCVQAQSLIENDIQHCSLCDEYFLYIDNHYETNKHQKMLKNELLSVQEDNPRVSFLTEDGNGMIIFEEQNE